MIHIDNPLAGFVVFALFLAGLIVYPCLKSDRVRITPTKTVAIVIAIGIVIYSGTLVFLFALLWPLSFIWFPEYWGNYTGFLRGSYIDQKSPPVLVSVMGWLFLVGFPLLILWITSG